jgi:hypothetical protein
VALEKNNVLGENGGNHNRFINALFLKPPPEIVLELRAI